MAQLSTTASRSALTCYKRALLLALIGALALLFAGSISTLNPSRKANSATLPAALSPRLTLSTAVAPVAGGDWSFVAVLESASRVDEPPAAESEVPQAEASADTGAQAAPASAAAVSATPATTSAAPAPVAAATTLSPHERWAARGIDLVVQGEAWDDQSFANVDAALSALPSRLLISLGNPALGAMHILVNSQGRALSGTAPYGGPANFYSTNDGVNELVLYPRQSPFTVLHELGHAYNLRRTPAGRYALVLLDPEMQSFMAATGWRVLSTDAQVRAAVDQIGVSYAYDGVLPWSNLSHNDPLEDFANSFALFFLDPQGLHSLSPARYDWFAANVGR